jgi:DNA-binding MarR family transcriptional regulator
MPDRRLRQRQSGGSEIVGVKNGNEGGVVRRGRNGVASVQAINFGPLATWIGFNLRMAQESAFQAFSRQSQEIGESPGRFATLTLIARNPGISQTELSQAAGRDKSSLTPVIEDLVRRGLVERKRLNHDRRAYCLNVTGDGKKTLTTMMRCARRHEKNLDKIIGLRDRARFLQILKKLAAGF